MRVPKPRTPNFITKYFKKFPGKSLLLDIYCEFFIFRDKRRQRLENRNYSKTPGQNASRHSISD
jgi:hypothetical protein